MPMSIINTKIINEAEKLTDQVKRQNKDMTMLLRETEMLNAQLRRVADLEPESQ